MLNEMIIQEIKIYINYNETYNIKYTTNYNNYICNI